MGIYPQVGRLFVMTGDMAIDYPVARQGFEKFIGVIAVVDTVDVNIIDVEQQVAVGFLQYGLGEFQL